MTTPLFSCAAGLFQDAGVIEAAYNLNNPLKQATVTLPMDCPTEHSYCKLSTRAVVLEAMKKV